MVVKTDKIVPIEVKSGKDYKKHNALNNLLTKDFDIEKAIIFSNANFSKEDKRLYLPIYFIMFIEKAKIKETIYKIDLSQLNNFKKEG